MSIIELCIYQFNWELSIVTILNFVVFYILIYYLYLFLLTVVYFHDIVKTSTAVSIADCHFFLSQLGSFKNQLENDKKFNQIKETNSLP